MMNENAEGKLKKRIGFLGLLAMCVGLNIGGALFALTGLAAGLTGPSLPIAMLISSIPALLAVVPYSILTSAWPTTSATYRYAQLVNPVLAFVCLLTLAVCIGIGGQPLFALGMGVYLKELIPINPILMGVIALTIFYIINLLGIQLTARVQTFLFFILVSALFLYIILGVPHVKAEHFCNLFPKGVGGLIAAAGLLFTFCAGGFFVIDLGGEVIMARKNFPRVLFTGMVMVIIFYMVIHVVTIGTIEWTGLKDKSLVAVAGNFMSRSQLIYFIIGGALIACATTINIIFSVVSRGLLVVSAEGLLPAFIGRVNERFGTPHWGLSVAYVICVISLITIPSLMFFGSMLNLGLIFAITVVTISGLLLYDRHPELYNKSSLKISPRLLKVICWIIIVMNSLIFICLLYTSPSPRD